MTRRPSDRGPVFVTGTSTGIGAATVDHLTERGFTVFAGVRNDSDAAGLREVTTMRWSR